MKDQTNLGSFNLSFCELIKEVPDSNIWYLIFSYYPEPNQRISSPFRTTTDKNCVFFIDSKDNTMKLKDFVTDKVYNSIECFYTLYNVTRNKACEMIHQALYDKQIVTRKKVVKDIVPKQQVRKKYFTIKYGSWTKNRMEYWTNLFVDREILDELHIRYASEVWMHTNLQCDWRVVAKDCFIYQFEDRVKIYNPLHPEYPKWLSSTKKTDIYGLDSIKGYDDMIITSSGKDVAVLRSILKRMEYKVDVIAPQSEMFIDITAKNTIVWFDNDEPGRKAAEKYSCRTVFQPEFKDPSDWVKERGIQPITEFISNLYGN